MGLALGIVAYRDPVALSQLLDSCSGFDEILVANVTVDPAVEAVARAHGCVHIEIAGNVGYAGGVNRLSAATSSDWLLVSNDDLVFGESVASACRAAACDDVDVVLPMLQTRGGVPTPSLRPIATPLRVLLEWVVLPDKGPASLGRCIQKWRIPSSPERVQGGTAAALLVRTDVIRDVEMDEGYFMYWEESDWFWRLRDLDRRVYFDPSIRITRSGGSTELGAEKWWWMGRNLVELGRSRYGWSGAGMYFLLALAWCGRLALTDSFGRHRSTRRRARLSAMRGACTALTGRQR